ncbi:MAG: hypothetical protein H6713_20770 [Myxococcales bacterium]|nr:hypothetical protein [Myxococcales bacterium]
MQRESRAEHRRPPTLRRGRTTSRGAPGRGSLARRAGLLAALLTVACGPDPAGSAAPAPRASRPVDHDAKAPDVQEHDVKAMSSAPAATDGADPPAGELAPLQLSSERCREPSEPGCASCCAGERIDEAGETRCMIRTWSGQGEPGPQAWYNGGHSTEGACPESCRACDPCTVRLESKARALTPRDDCDCAAPPGPDACFQPNSCGCYCTRRAELVAACPQVFAAPEAGASAPE